MCAIIDHNGCRIHVAIIPGMLTRSGARFVEAILSVHPSQVEAANQVSEEDARISLAGASVKPIHPAKTTEELVA